MPQPRELACTEKSVRQEDWRRGRGGGPSRPTEQTTPAPQARLGDEEILGTENST